MSDDPFLRVDEVATELRVSRETVRRLLRDGKLRGVRPGSTKMGWRIRRSALAAYLQGEYQLELPKTSDDQGKRAA